MESERIQLRAEYEEKIGRLQLEIAKEQETNDKAAAELENLRRSYQNELNKINKPAAPLSVAAAAASALAGAENGRNDEILKKLSICILVFPLCIKSTNLLGIFFVQLIRRKLMEIESKLVGGERANDKEFQDRRWKKKSQVERRAALLSQLLAKTRDEDGALLRVYDDIQQEIRVKGEVIKKYKTQVIQLFYFKWLIFT